jgi:hypothetical protein
LRIYEGGVLEADEEADDEEEDEEVREPLKQGAPMKDWNALGPGGKRKQSQKAFDELKKTARARNVEPERLAGTLLHR